MASLPDLRTLGRDSTGKYVPERALELIPAIHSILHLFMGGSMAEAEQAVMEGDSKSETLYYSLGQGLIQSFKAIMSFQDEDMQRAINTVAHTNTVSNSHRRRTSNVASAVVGFVSGSTSGAAWIKGMTPVERHAELTYAESTLMKALLTVLYSGDWLSFIREALNMRAVNQSYRAMDEFLKDADVAAGGRDTSIDEHFRTGVLFGAGVNSLALSLLPSRVTSVIQIFGYRGDRTEALAMLSSAGGWTKDSDEPFISREKEGVRRCIVDITLLLFHLLMSNWTNEGVDLSMARKILNWNLDRSPNGPFFLFSEGRLRVCQGQPELALPAYKKMIEICRGAGYNTMEHISSWELGIAYLSLNDMPGSIPYWRELRAEANWSKCVYTYALASALIQNGKPESLKEAADLMAEVPNLTQKIAGKSIPLEKFAARKARKYAASGSLFLPAMDLSYHFFALEHAPRRVLIGSTSHTSYSMLDEIENALAILEEKRKNAEFAPALQKKSGKKGSSESSGYWDDWCLGMFLKGVVLRYVAFPDHDAVPEALQGAKSVPSKQDAANGAFRAFQDVLAHGADIELDHHLVYYAHYELGRLFACAGRLEEGKEHLELVLSGKTLVPKPGKGKYSMESQLILKTNAALESLGATAV